MCLIITIHDCYFDSVSLFMSLLCVFSVPGLAGLDLCFPVYYVNLPLCAILYELAIVNLPTRQDHDS